MTTKPTRPPESEQLRQRREETAGSIGQAGRSNTSDVNANHEEVCTMTVRTPTKDEANARSAGSDKPNPPATDRKALIDGLNHDLAGEYQAIVMYIQYSAKLTGPYRRELRPSSRPRLRTNRDTLSSWRTRLRPWAANRRPSRARYPTPTSRRKCWNTRWRPRNKRSRTTTSGCARRMPSGMSASR